MTCAHGKDRARVGSADVTGVTVRPCQDPADECDLRRRSGMVGIVEPVARLGTVFSGMGAIECTG